MGLQTFGQKPPLLPTLRILHHTCNGFGRTELLFRPSPLLFSYFLLHHPPHSLGLCSWQLSTLTGLNSTLHRQNRKQTCFHDVFFAQFSLMPLKHETYFHFFTLHFSIFQTYIQLMNQAERIDQLYQYTVFIYKVYIKVFAPPSLVLIFSLINNT